MALVAAAGLCAVLAAPGPDLRQATIHGVSLGMTRLQVRDLLGPFQGWYRKRPGSVQYWGWTGETPEVAVLFDPTTGRVVAAYGERLEVGGRVLVDSGAAWWDLHRRLGRPGRWVTEYCGSPGSSVYRLPDGSLVVASHEWGGLWGVDPWRTRAYALGRERDLLDLGLLEHPEYHTSFPR